MSHPLPPCDCICGHRHPRKSKCAQCPCRYGTDDRKASLRAQRRATEKGGE